MTGTSKRNILTADADCPTCNGTGRHVYKAPAPGYESFIGKCPQVEKNDICRCVRASSELVIPV